ncbi:MAG: SDR family NAD(P)-dependent oxidoreductase [Candidatus Heimdallarchaeota archaeon]|nr:SDR family NAD(P)-dependent oxidoreductase [Candidatus Heimdallarchaeota archaeon]
MTSSYKLITSNEEINKNKVALVTGANSGIGFETAARLANEGFGKVILAVRSVEKGKVATTRLLKRVDKDVFEILVMDTSDSAKVHEAADQLEEIGSKIDLLILNAGMTPKKPNTLNDEGIEMTFASHIVGHHILTMRLLAADLLTSTARIVIASSEGSLGGAFGMKVADFDTIANEHFDGSLDKTMDAIMRYQAPYEGKTMDIYVTTKTFSNWWAAVMSRKLPEGMVVNAISPGSVPATNYVKNAPFMMRRFLVPMMKYIGKYMGMAWKVEEGANRYYEAGHFEDDNTGHFYASKPGKFTGPMEIQDKEHFLNKE